MECLNIDYHVKRLLLIAMARYRYKKEQAEALCISVEGLNSLLIKYKLNVHTGITKQGRSGNAKG